MPIERVLAALPPAWSALLADRLTPDDFAGLEAFLADAGETYPAREDRYAALALTPPERSRVVILGQDPYHGPGQAHGLAFSVRPGVKVPPSLANIYRELRDDLGIAPAAHGELTHWARQGVLLLNTVLSVAPGRAGSHRRRGWERLTDAILTALASGPRPLAVMLWGKPAQATADAIPALADPRHLVLRAPHPSPLSAYTGFFGSRPFSTVNAWLTARGEPPIDWRLPAA